MDVHEPEVRSYNQWQQNFNIGMNLKAKIGTRIKELRIEKGFTQEELAWHSKIDRTFMNHVENSQRNISIETLEKIICLGLRTDFRKFFNSEIFENNQ